VCVCVCVRVCMCVYVCVCAYACMCVHFKRVFAHTGVCVCVKVWVYLCVLCLYRCLNMMDEPYLMETIKDQVCFVSQ
jgi:hypothetical protein